MPAAARLTAVLRLCDPRQDWPWSCPAPTPEQLQSLLSSATEVSCPILGDGTPESHVGRILYLAKHGWSDPIEIDVGVPVLGYSGPAWPVTDGNHRLWAATLREDTHILVDVAGQIDHATRILGLSENAIVGHRTRRGSSRHSANPRQPFMTPAQFDVLAKLTRAREPARTAARRVLVDGIRPADAARENNMSQPALGNTLRRYRLYDAMIRSAYVDQPTKDLTPTGTARKNAL